MRSGARKTSPAALVWALGLVALLVAAPVASADEGPTRAEYVAKLEPICKSSTQSNSRILKGVRGQVQRNQLAPAGRRFVRASRVLGRGVTQMAKVPRPSADSAKLKTWFDYLKRERGLLQRIGKALQAGKKFQAQKQAVQLNRNNKRANNTIIAFGFKECRIDSSRFL